MADDNSFNQWLQRQHGLGALLLPLIVVVILVLVLMRQRDEQPPQHSNDASFQDYPFDPKGTGPDPKPEPASPTETPPTTPPVSGEVPRLEQSPPPAPVPGRGVPLDPERPMRDQGSPGPPGEIE